MNRLSLRWRIALMMGVLVFCASALLTIFSIHNASMQFVEPLTQISNLKYGNHEQGDIFSFENDAKQLPDNIYFKKEVDFIPEIAQRTFSVFSILCMLLITIGSALSAYYLAGKALRPVTKLNDEMSGIDGSSLGTQVTVPPTNDEISALSKSFNLLLERLEQEFIREKQFSANVAHELKTPLATIITNAQVLKLNEGPTFEEANEFIDITLQNAKRLSDVVNSLLLLYQLNKESKNNSINLVSLFSDIEKELKPLYSEKGIKIKYDLEIQEVTGNVLLLYRAFFNLVENAYKYTNRNGKIIIKSYHKDSKVVLSISDDGVGISAEDQVHIFEPFYCVDKSRSRKISGAGLGLSITKEILLLHNAHISVDSDLNKGTTMNIVFEEK